MLRLPDAKPLDVYPSVGRDGMLPTTALTDRLVNNVYGIIDRDFIKRNLITGSPTLESQNKTLANLQKIHNYYQVLLHLPLLVQVQVKMVGIVHFQVMELVQSVLEEASVY